MRKAEKVCNSNGEEWEKGKSMERFSYDVEVLVIGDHY